MAYAALLVQRSDGLGARRFLRLARPPRGQASALRTQNSFDHGAAPVDFDHQGVRFISAVGR